MKTNSILLSLAVLALAGPAAAEGLPSCAVGMKVIVSPLNNDAVIIGANPAQGSYQVRSLADQLVDWVPARALRYSCTGAAAAAADTGYFVGTWNTFVGAVPLTTIHGGKAYTEVSMGGHGRPIQVNGDGTYVWQVDSSTTVRGRWRTMAAAEVRSGTTGPAILLINGEGGKQWQMSGHGVNAGNGHDQASVDRMDLGVSYMVTRR